MHPVNPSDTSQHPASPPAKFRSRGSTAGWLLLLMVSVVSLVLGWSSLQNWLQPAAPDGFWLELEIQAARPLTIECYFDAGRGYSERDVVRIAIEKPDTWQRVQIPLPPAQIRELRLDPGRGESVVRLRHPTLLRRTGAVLARWSAQALRPGQDIVRSDFAGDVLTVEPRPPPPESDPMLFLDVPLPAITQAALERPTPPPWVWVAYGLTVMGSLLAVIFAGWQALQDGRATRPWVILAAAWLGIFGLRLFWVRHFGTWIPYFDEWDAELRTALLPWRSGTFDWAGLFAPHNEHRVALSRLFAIATTWLNGEWEPRVGMVFNAGLVATFGSLVIVALREHCAWFRDWFILGLIVLLGGPFDPESLLWSGQSQMYLLVLTALLTLVLALASVEDPAQFGWAALLGGLLSLGAMGSGAVAPAVAALLIVTRSAWIRSWHKGAMGVAVGLGAVAALGFATRTDSAQLVPLRADSLGEFLHAFRAVAPWPLPANWGWVALMWLPALLLLARFRNRTQLPTRDRLPWIAAAVAGWALLHVVALAYFRAHALIPEARHFTLLVATPVGAILAVGCLKLENGAHRTWLRSGLIVILLATPVTGLALANVRGIPAARELQVVRRQQEAAVRQYLTDGDTATFGQLRFPAIPYWDPTALAMLLEQPDIRDDLPSALRQRAAPRWQLPATSVAPGPLSKIARDVSKAGIFLFAASGLGLSVWFARQRSASGAAPAPPPS